MVPDSKIFKLEIATWEVKVRIKHFYPMDLYSKEQSRIILGFKKSYIKFKMKLTVKILL